MAIALFKTQFGPTSTQNLNFLFFLQFLVKFWHNWVHMAQNGSKMRPNGPKWVQMSTIMSTMGGMVGPSWANLGMVGPIWAWWLGLVLPFLSTLVDIAHAKCECWFDTCFIDVFWHPLGCQKSHHVPCRGCLGAILGGLGSYLDPRWGILCHVGAILGELGGYLVQLGST